MKRKTQNFDPSRRRFLQDALISGICLGSGLLPSLSSATPANAFPKQRGRILVDLTLAGGPDFRHLLPPPFSHTRGSYGRTFWEHRARAFGISNSLSSLEQHWQSTYTPVSSGHTRFGIRNNCGWLLQQWEAGNVAIVNNVYGADSRDHEHAIRVMALGDTAAGKFDEGSGWGGRLAHAAGGNAVALTGSPSRFTFSPDPNAPHDLRKSSQDRLVVASDTRNIALYAADPDASWISASQHTTLALQNYYQAKGRIVEEHSPFHRFFEHERKLREFGDAIDSRLADIAIPPRLEQLTSENSPVRRDLGLQVRNLHDALVCADILDMRVASMTFGGWDSHDQQAEHINPMLGDMFGSDGAFARLYKTLPKRVRDKLVFVISGEFGRQLADNGGNGTDHGVGNTVLLIGNGVRGGLYGDLFPNQELRRFREVSADIRGLTAIDHVFGAAAEWTEPGSRDFVFPQREGKNLEKGLNANRLFL